MRERGISIFDYAIGWLVGGVIAALFHQTVAAVVTSVWSGVVTLWCWRRIDAAWARRQRRRMWIAQLRQLRAARGR